MRLQMEKMFCFTMVKTLLTVTIILGVLIAQEYQIVTQQITITQNPMTSDSLLLKGAIGKNFYSSESGDSLTLKGGFWNIASGFYLIPPSIESSFPDTIQKNEKGVYAEAIVHDINGIETVELHVQLGGSNEIIILPMDEINDSTYRVPIYDSLRSVLNFRSQIVTLDGMYNENRTNQNSPHLQFARTELTMADSMYSFYPEGIPKEKWRLFSFPGKLDNIIIESSSLEDGHVFYDWDPNKLEWVKPDSIITGRGYWFKHQYSDPAIFKNTDTTGYAVPLEDYTIQLVKGANMVGNPFSFSVEAEYSEGVSMPYKYGSDNKEGWADTNVFEPWAGYAVYSPSDTGTITFKAFPDASIANRSISDGWEIELDVIGDKYFDRRGKIGRKKDAKDIIDVYDIPILPAPGRSLMLAMDIEGEGLYDHSSDIRSNRESNGVWNIQIIGNGDPGPIRFTGFTANGIPQDLIIALIDIATRTVVKEFLEEGLTIKNKVSGVYDLKLIAGEESFVLQMVNDILADIPVQYSLGQNYPNPFNPITKIDFALPKTGEVSLVIYNLMGQEIKTLISDNMQYGFHTATWNGIDQFGRTVSSGVYFSELRAKGFRQTKKMLLIK